MGAVWTFAAGIGCLCGVHGWIWNISLWNFTVRVDFCQQACWRPRRHWSYVFACGWELSSQLNQTRCFLFGFSHVWCCEWTHWDDSSQWRQAWFASGKAAFHPLCLLLCPSSICSCVPSVSPAFIYKLKLQRRRREERKWRIKTSGQSSTTLLLGERAHYPLLSSLFHSLFLLSGRLFLRSSSAPLRAGFKYSKCEEFKSVWVNTTGRKPPTSHLYWLAPCFLCFSCHDLLPLKTVCNLEYKQILSPSKG